MKRRLLSQIPDGVPQKLAEMIGRAPVFDSSCSPEASVWFVDRDGGFYIKRAAAGTLRREAEMTAYFYSKGLSAEVLDYCTEENFDWLVTARVAGEDCTHADYLADPKRLCDLLAERLRMLHETDFEDCPVQNRMQSYLALADENYRAGRYDLSLLGDRFPYATADEAYAVLESGRGAFESNVLLHGDYCLPNVMLDNWHFSGFIDLGNGGVGDRHVDLFWGAWTLWYNLSTDRYRDRFFDAYGRDEINPEFLDVVAAAEVFG